MAITYPLTPPSPFRISKLSLSGLSVTSRNVSPFTFQIQQYNWPGQAWLGQVECPPMVRADAEAVIAFLLAAQRGTFYFQDYANPTRRGNVTGTLTSTTTTSAALGAIGNAVNTSGKALGTTLYNTTTKTFYVAQGTTNTATWIDSADGTTTITPA